MRELALFAGAGGGILGGRLLGWRTVCAVELAPYARGCLLARQADGCLDRFPIWDDVTTFDGRPWRGHVDIVTGGFPCQDISVAGSGAGIDGERSGLWGEMARIIGEVGPRYVLVENSPALTTRGLGRVLGDLAAMGFDAEWGVLGADDAGAPHVRKRIWILAHADRERWNAPRQREVCAGVEGKMGEWPPVRGADRTANLCVLRQWIERCALPDGARGDDGVAHRVDRLKAIGNGQVPAVVALAWRTLAERAGIAP